jgi:hypothetical protein
MWAKIRACMDIRFDAGSNRVDTSSTDGSYTIFNTSTKSTTSSTTDSTTYGYYVLKLVDTTQIRRTSKNQQEYSQIPLGIKMRGECWKFLSLVRCQKNNHPQLPTKKSRRTIKQNRRRKIICWQKQKQEKNSIYICTQYNDMLKSERGNILLWHNI